LTEVTLEELLKYLEIGPVMAQMSRLSLAFLPLEKLQIFDNAAELVSTLDCPEVQSDHSLMLTLDWKPQYTSRLIPLKVRHNPLTTELNQVLKPRWEFLQSILPCQSKLPELIAQPTGVSCTIVILVDGLSWADFSSYWPDTALAQPVLVDGASTTEQGMKRIVGKPPIAERLFAMGYDRTYGFSYWTREDNFLTDRLFVLFGNNVEKVRDFQDVLERLKDIDLNNAYVQIVRQGLDGLCHRHRDRPNPETYVKDLAQDWNSLLELLQKQGVSAQVFLTSDHGILWKEGHDLQVWMHGKWIDSPRYLKYSYPSPQTLEVNFEDNNYTLLNYPYIGRDFKSNEWGMHGGLSFEESIVPLLTANIN
jgi:hypothetical protein